jgi:hypothetical protein
MAGSGGSQTGSALRKWKRGRCHPLKKKGTGSAPTLGREGDGS